MTEPRPKDSYFTNTTLAPDGESVEATIARLPTTPAMPSGEVIDPLDEFVRWDRLSDEALRLIESQPTLLERVDALEALALDLFKRVQKMEAKQNED